MRSSLSLYLCGCMSYLKSVNKYTEAILWRSDLARRLVDLNIKKGYVKYNWFDPTVNSEENYITANSKTVVKQNDYYLDKCDIVVANLEYLDKSPGSLYEIFMYKFLDKPVIAFGEDTGGLLNSPHIAESITVKLDSVDEVMEYIESYYHS